VFPALLLHSLRGRRDWRGSLPKRFFGAAKYVVRSIWMARLQARWLSFLFRSGPLSLLAIRDPRLYERPQHHYISRDLSSASRFEIIESHYRFVASAFPVKLMRRVYMRGHASLGRLQLKDGSEVEFRLSLPTGRSREGELALYLLRADGSALSSMIFTVAANGLSLLIGCIQGAAGAGDLGRDAVRDFTKQSYGLRPKNLLLSMLYALVAATRIDQVFGVGNTAHPFAGSGKIKADYDSFWQECGGVVSDDGFYYLPSREPVRDEAQVESKHRSTFRKREALRHQACELIYQTFSPRRLKDTETESVLKPLRKRDLEMRSDLIPFR
jgi:uncharacterized protein VirK/YbjX